jgi:hypothetical protein
LETRKGSRKKKRAEENPPKIGSIRFREFEEIWESTLEPALVNVLVVIINKGVNVLNREVSVTPFWVKARPVTDGHMLFGTSSLCDV